MKQTIYSIAAMIGMALIGVQAAQADVTVKYKIYGKHGKLLYQAIRYTDKNHVRVDAYDGNSLVGTGLRIGEKVYAIHDGQVMDMTEGMGSMLGRFGVHMPSSKPAAPPRVEYTGRTETIIGIKGKVYQEFEEGRQSFELVLVRNRDLFNAWMASVKLMHSMSAGMSSGQAMPGFRPNHSIAGMAPLRIGRGVGSGVLVSMKMERIPRSVLALPTGARPRSMTRMMMDGRGSGGDRVSHSRHIERSRHKESVVEKDAKDIGEYSINEAHQSAKQGIQNGISDQIEKGIGGLMNGLFGR